MVEEALKHDIHLETSYAYDIEIIKKLYARKKITKDTYILCNGFKQKPYTNRIANLLNTGFKNVIPILDNKDELRSYIKSVKVPFNLGIRIATEEEPTFPFYTSRLGIKLKDVLEFYVDKIKGKFLIIHGTGDDNVHFQNSVMFSEALIQANKPFEQAYYPNKNHGIYGGNTTLHLYSKMTDFILKNL